MFTVLKALNNSIQHGTHLVFNIYVQFAAHTKPQSGRNGY